MPNTVIPRFQATQRRKKQTDFSSAARDRHVTITVLLIHFFQISETTEEDFFINCGLQSDNFRNLFNEFRTILPDFSRYNIPKWEIYTKYHNIYQMAVKYTEIFHSNALQNMDTQIGILGMQTCTSSGNCDPEEPRLKKRLKNRRKDMFYIGKRKTG
jgi:hypothetical protein